MTDETAVIIVITVMWLWLLTRLSLLVRLWSLWWECHDWWDWDKNVMVVLLCPIHIRNAGDKLHSLLTITKTERMLTYTNSFCIPKGLPHTNIGKRLTRFTCHNLGQKGKTMTAHIHNIDMLLLFILMCLYWTTLPYTDTVTDWTV